MGNSTEKKFDRWAKNKLIKLKEPHHLLDEKFHTDRLEVDRFGKVISFISIKPQSFYSNYLQYKDVFSGLQAISNFKGIPWKIYYNVGDNFKLIHLESLNMKGQSKNKKLAEDYSKEELSEIIPFLNKL